MVSSESSELGIAAGLDRVADFFSRRWWIWIAVPLGVALWRNGLRLFPQASIIQHIVMARDFPQAAELPPNAHYIYNSMVGAILAHYLNLATPRGWILLSVVAIAVAVAVIALMARQAADTGAIGVVMCLFAAGATSSVLFDWVGSYDVYTIIGLTLIALSRRSWISALGGVIVGANAAEVGILALVVLALAGWADDRRQWPRVGSAVAGLVFAYGILRLWQSSNDLGTSRFASAESIGLSEMFTDSLHAMPLLALTWFATAWLFVAWAAWRRVVTWWRLLVALLVAFVPAMLVLDQTRIGVLISWPLLLWLAITCYRMDPEPTKRAAIAVLLISCIFPAVVVWEGKASVLTAWLG